MKKKKVMTVLALSFTAVMLLCGLTGCGSEKQAAAEATSEAAEEATEDTAENIEETEDQASAEGTVSAGAQDTDGQKEAEPFDKTTDMSETEQGQEKPTEIDQLLEAYYEEVLLPEQGLIELPAGYEVSIKEKHFENYTIGEAFLQEKGICYHAVWDYDKDGQEELLVLALDEDKDYERSKLYARMYEVEASGTDEAGTADANETETGEVVLSAELESLFGWMECDTSQSMEVFLRETKDWFYLAEEARGYNSIYADGSNYAIRAAHYDGTDFVVDVAKQLSGSDFGETEESVAETARLLRNITFDHTADNLTYEYSFDESDDLLSVFYMSAEPNGTLDTYYRTGNISDVPPFLIRLFAGRE